MKDHETFLNAASRVVGERTSVRFVLVGRDTPTLAPCVARHGLGDRVFLLGERCDVDRLLPGIDIACLSSISEGFPNVLGEAMACEVPCVTTDAGDARLIVGDTGLVVPPRDPAALAGAMLELIDRGPAGRRILGQAARARIEKEYALPRIVERYETVYEELCQCQA
jgi:glycosyltransferase involved in cell wall biosynthesis